MAERYTRVFSFEDRLYSENSPVIVEAGALLKDNKTGGLLAQLKFKNISGRSSNIKALRVQITQFDISDNTLGSPVEFQYLDISVPRDEEFGSKTPIPMTDTNTRKMVAIITEAVFEDGFIWNQISTTNEVLVAQRGLDESIQDNSLIKQFQLEFGAKCGFEYTVHKDLWFCPCGAINRSSEENCHTCKNKASNFASLDIGALSARKAEREQKESEEAAERERKKAEAAEEARRERERIAEIERIEAEERNKRIKKNIMIFGPIVAVCIAFLVLLNSVIIPSSKYNQAMDYLNSSNYTEALEIFEEIPNFKDSSEKIKDCKSAIYAEGVSLFDDEQYVEAAKKFERISPYENCAELIAKCEHFQSGTYRAMVDQFALTSFSFPDGVTSISEGIFKNCTSLTSVTIPNSVTSIGDGAFSGCDNLTSITIPDSVTSIGDSAFSHCESLVSITIPDSVKSIGDNAFEGCENLKSITIPDSVTSIGSDAFYNCTSLTSVTIGNGVTSIGDDAFSGCTSLKSVTIPDSVTSIGDDAFRGCENLKSITIPNSVKSIGEYAFYECTRLTSVTISDSVTSIGDYAFKYCTKLFSITIGNGIKSIGKDAFDECDSLNRVYIDDLVNWCGISFETLSSTPLVGADLYLNGECVTNLIIPDSVADIGDGAFYRCNSITSVTIPNNVVVIGDCAFRGCSNLKSATFENTSGWYAYQYSLTQSGHSVNVSNPTNAAKYLTDFYYGSYIWKRS